MNKTCFENTLWYLVYVHLIKSMLIDYNETKKRNEER